MWKRLNTEQIDLISQLVSFGLLFSVFIGVIIWVSIMRRSKVKHMSELPLSDGESQATTPEQKTTNPSSNDEPKQ